MNSTRCSRVGVALAALALLVAAVAPAVAVSVSADGVPDRAQSGEKVSATFTLTELYTDYDSWTLRASTALEDATWTITRYDNKGTQLGEQRTVTGANVTQAIGGETTEVTVRLEGRTPEVANFTYEPAQTFRFASLEQTQEGGTADSLDAWSVVHYTEESEAARAAIDDAADAIDDAESGGADTAEAEGLLESAISAFDNDNFENAESLAEDAAEKADSASQSKQTTTLLLLAGGAVVVLAVVALLVYLYLQRRQANQFDKLG